MKKPDPVAQRAIIMEMVFELAESLSPQDGTWLSAETEHKVAAVDRALCHALKISPESPLEI